MIPLPQTLAGGPEPGFSNAVGVLASFSNPTGTCIDRAGQLYVADTGNNVIRKILPSGLVTTYAGSGVAGSQLGPAPAAQFQAPVGVAAARDQGEHVSNWAFENFLKPLDDGK